MWLALDQQCQASAQLAPGQMVRLQQVKEIEDRRLIWHAARAVIQPGKAAVQRGIPPRIARRR